MCSGFKVFVVSTSITNARALFDQTRGGRGGYAKWANTPARTQSPRAQVKVLYRLLMHVFSRWALLLRSMPHTCTALHALQSGFPRRDAMVVVLSLRGHTGDHTYEIYIC